MKKTIQIFIAVLMISALLALPAFAGTIPGIQPRENSGAGADDIGSSDNGLGGDSASDGSNGIFGEDSGAMGTDFGDTSNAPGDSDGISSDQGGAAGTGSAGGTNANGSAGENAKSTGDGADSGADYGINTENGDLSGQIADGGASEDVGKAESPADSANGARWLMGLLAVVAAAAVIGLSVMLVPKTNKPNRTQNGSGSNDR